jgi:amino acid adenylation domain-containing protein
MLDYPTRVSDVPLVGQILAYQAEQIADRTAVSNGRVCLTYGQLYRQALALSADLVAMGVEPESLVGICVERSLEMIIGIWGILLAGGAYVPIDPAYPQQRISHIISDAGLKIILTQSPLVERLPRESQDSAQLVCLDNWQMDHKPTAPKVITSRQLAYVIYTSGSTGQPKGVMIEHGALGAFVAAAVTAYGMRGSDRFLQFASLSFDVAVEEIFTCAAVGGTLMLRNEECLQSISKFLELCQNWQISICNLPTAYWHQLVDYLAAQKQTMPPSVRLVIIGGEKVQRHRVEKWLSTVGSYPRLINGYGPTETTVTATIYPVETLSTGEIPIGKALGNCQTFILDEKLQPVAPGQVGQLCISGPTLARGYLNRPELTATKFCTPASLGLRIYQTGDLVKLLPDGNLEYLDRADFQVKVRGFRIELGEIEACLAGHPGVREAVVLAQDDPNAGKRLVAYVVPRAPIVTAQLEQFLSDRLPEYMVPRLYVVLEELPITVNGKIDRAALSSMEVIPTKLDLSPQQGDPLEAQLAKIWQQVLGTESVGLDDNFFDLGGDSISALRLFTQIEIKFQRQLPLATLLQAPTVRTLAELLRSAGWQPNWRSLVQIQAGNSKQAPLFCIHPVGGNVVGYYSLAKHLGPEQPIYGLQAKGLDGQEPPLENIAAMASFYLEEMRTVQPKGPYRLLGYSFGGVVAYEITQQLLQLGEQVSLLVFLDVFSPELFYRGTPKPIEQLQIHYNNLKQTGWQTLGRYIWTRLAPKWEQILHKTIGKYYRWRGQSDPKAVPEYFVEVELANDRAMAAYQPKPLAQKIYQFKTQERPTKNFDEITLGWGELAPVEVITIPGHHGTMLHEPYVGLLSQKLKDYL